jgi:hypothetical protein
MVVYWDTRLRLGVGKTPPWLVALLFGLPGVLLRRLVGIKSWLTIGLVFGFAAGLLFHNTDWIKKLSGHYLPVNADPLHRVRGWSDVARVAGVARKEVLVEGKPTFIITDHYGIAGEISFYLPEAKAALSQTPLVYVRSSPTPKNQFFYWPGYTLRKGENAVFVIELDRKVPDPKPAPKSLQDEFESVTDMGVRNVMYHGQLLRPLQFFACRNLK